MDNKQGQAIGESGLIQWVMERLAFEVGLEGWSCDGGTAVAALVAQELGFLANRQVGHYWHASADTLVAIRGGAVGDYQGQPMDEHHHWLEGEGWLYDANGEVRGEPNYQALTPRVRACYQPDKGLDWDHYRETAPEDWLAEMAPPKELAAVAKIPLVLTELRAYGQGPSGP